MSRNSDLPRRRAGRSSGTVSTGRLSTACVGQFLMKNCELIPSVEESLGEIVRIHSELLEGARFTLEKAMRVGELLTGIKGGMKHGEWLPWLEKNVPFTRATAANYMRLHENKEKCKRLLHLEDAYRLLGGGSKPHVSHNAGQNEWYTPVEYVEAAREVMGEIDCDPASSKIANKTVQAKVFFSKEQDGLGKDWVGNVWMNPPYAQPLVDRFSEVMTWKFENGEVKQACILVNNATETEWFQRMLKQASAVCFITGRIHFIDPEGKPSGAPLQGQCVLYLGKAVGKFGKEFGKFGKVLYAAR